MKNAKLLITVMLASFLLASVTTVAQSLSISGVVKDKKTKETIIGANVLIQGTTTGTISDINGRFSITNLKKGVYTVVISYISYATYTIEGVKASEDTQYDLIIELEESQATLNEVTINGARVTNTEFAVINSIKSAGVVLTGISAQQISKSQDKDAAEIVRRIPGVTIASNKFVRIRGLDERYNQVMLDDSPAPSMEADVRAFAFDIIPSSLIDRIIVHKSPSADIPGDFAGGTVKIFTKNLPEKRFVEVSIGTGYRNGTTFEEFKAAPSGRMAWTGFNDGSHDLPANFPKDLRLVPNGELTDAGRSLPNSWVAETRDAGLNKSLSITAGTVKKLGRATLGNITSLQYGNSNTTYKINRYDYMEYDKEAKRSTYLFDFTDIEYTNNIRVGLLHNYALNLGKSSFEFKNFYNRISTSQYILRTGIHYDFNYIPENHSFDQVYRGIYKGQLNGRHKLLNDRLSVEWIANYNNSYRDQPDYRRYRSDVDTVEQTRRIYIPLGSAASYFLGRFYSDMNELSSSATTAVTYKPLKSDMLIVPTIKAGVYYEDKSRSFVARNIGYVRTTQSDPNLQNLSIDELFSHENINNTTGIRIDEQSNAADSYNATNRQSAIYLSVNTAIATDINLTGGLRVENNVQTLSSGALASDINKQETTLLPSVNLSYNFNDAQLVRIAYGRTLNRPEFRELAPFGFYDFALNLVKKGNRELLNASISNFDLRYEYYPSPSELVTFGLFLKKFTNPIETQFVPGGGSGGIKDFTYSNANGATGYGAEVEIRKTLAGLTNSEFFDNIGILFNGAYIKSTIKLPDSLKRQSVKRPMQGQSPYIINAGIFYKNMKNGLQVNMLYNVTGKYIYSIGFDIYPDIYQMPRNIIDITLTKTITKNAEIKIGITDLLNQPYHLMQDVNNDGRFDINKDQTIQHYKPGTVFNVGFTYKM